MLDGGGGPSLANARKAQEIIDEVKEVEGVVSTPSNPFLAQARADAADDALVGIQREEPWIKQRAKELYKAAKAKKPKPDELPEYLHRNEFPDLIRRLDKDDYPDRVAQQVYTEIIAEHYKKAEASARELISRETIIQEEIEKRTKIIKDELEEKNYQQRLRSAKTTILFLRSAMLTILIPILSLLPSDWRMLQLLPLIGVAWLNWKPMREMHEMMKNLKNERIIPQDSQ